MKRRKLGTTGTEVGAVGIGALSFSNFYGPTDEQKSHAILDAARDLGIDHVDTANVYGNGISEERIGTYLAKQGSKKHDVFKIATKVGMARDADGNRRFDNSEPYMRAELEKSLGRLGLENIELYYVHRREAERPIEEVTTTLQKFVDEGKINQFGFSEIAPTTLKLASDVHAVGAVQSEYSLSTRAPEMGLLQMCENVGASLVAFCPVGRSLLTDRPHALEKAQTLEFLKGNPRFQEPNLSRNIAAGAPFRELAADMGVAAATLAIAWVLHKGPHTIAIPGTRSTNHLAELAAGGTLDLSDDDMVEIERRLPVGWAHGDRYSVAQWVGPEKYG